MSSLDIAPRPGGCTSSRLMPVQDGAPVSDVVPADESLHHWRLGFRQSSFRHITRVSQRTAPNAWAQPLVSWHAPVPFTFRLQVSHQTQECSSKFLPTWSG